LKSFLIKTQKNPSRLILFLCYFKKKGFDYLLLKLTNKSEIRLI